MSVGVDLFRIRPAVNKSWKFENSGINNIGDVLKRLTGVSSGVLVP